MTGIMKISFITLFPEVIQSYISTGLLARAKNNSVLDFEILNIRDAIDKNYKSADDTVYGGSDGALLQYQPLQTTLNKVNRSAEAKTIYLSPQGKVLNQKLIDDLKNEKHLILISGRYAGIDQRFISKYVDMEVSVGDYVLSGGELPSLILVEALSRQINGVLGNNESVKNDSFSHRFLEAPQFTKPSEIDEMKVPDILLSGDHQKIANWKKNMSVLITLKKREDIIQQNRNDINWPEVYRFYKNMSDTDKTLMQVEDLDKLIGKYINL